MSTNVSRRIAATFQGGRDPDQDQIVEWLKTLPVSDKGNVERSVMKYHITRALLSYIQSGTTLQSKHHMAPVVSSVPVVESIVPVVTPRQHIVEPVKPVKSMPVADPVPVVQVVPVAHSVSQPEVAEVSKPKTAGSFLRNKIAKSMNSGT